MQENQFSTERETKIKAAQIALGEPFGLEFKEPVSKMRTHLLVAAVISVFATLLELKIKPDAPVFGVQFDGLTEKKILIGLITINVYLLLHFLWSSIDVFKEWRLRRTGTMVAYVDAAATSFFGDESLDFGDDPRQSTLYHWWSQITYRMIPLPQAIDAVDKKITMMMDSVMLELNKGQTPELANWQTTFMSLRNQLTKVTESLNDAKKVIESERIPASLQRYDSAFKALLNSQNIRWLVLEWLFPLLLGTAAICLLVYKVFAV